MNTSDLNNRANVYFNNNFIYFFLNYSRETFNKFPVVYKNYTTYSLIDKIITMCREDCVLNMYSLLYFLSDLVQISGYRKIERKKNTIGLLHYNGHLDHHQTFISLYFKPCVGDSETDSTLIIQRANETCQRLIDNNIINGTEYTASGSIYSSLSM